MGVGIERWRRAQKAEELAQRRTSSRPPGELTQKTVRSNVERMCKYTRLSEEELEHMRILEIGGRVVERAFDSVNIAPKLILDPLLSFPRLLGQQDKSCKRVRGMGEHLPLRDRSLDLCWCANTIDHTLSPVAVLREIRRVLVDRGILVISCNVFRTWMKPLFPVLNYLDAPHAHHFTLAGFRALVEQEFEIQREEFEVYSRSTQARTLKATIAELVGMKHVYFRCGM